MNHRTRMQQDLDDRIAQLELELCELKRERNALSPISQLPPELLCKILSYNLLTLFEDYLEKPLSNPISPTLCFSHVSRVWRAILLKSTQMWSYIRVGRDTKPELVKLMWANTGLAPVDMKVDTPFAIDTDALIDMLRQHPAKLRSICLRLEVGWIKRIFEAGTTSFDNLEDLLISHPRKGWTSFSKSSIGLECLACKMPALRRFWATGHTVPLNCPFLSSVTLKDIRIYQDQGTIEDMLNFVREGSGRIHFLEMGIDTTPSMSDLATARSTQQLTSLRTLHFKYFHLQSSYWRTLATILSTLRLSAPHLNFCCGNIPTENLHELFTAVAHACGGNLSPREVRFSDHSNISFWEHPITHPLVDGVRCMLPAGTDFGWQQPERFIAIAGPIPFEDPRHYQASWSFANLKVLTIASRVPGALWAVLAHSTPLEVLRVGDLVDCYEMFDAIRTPGVATAGSTPFPHLQVLVSTHGVPQSYYEHRTRLAAGFTTPVVKNSIRQYALELADMLKARQSLLGQSASLALLEFRGVSEKEPDAEALTILYTVAKNVVWDTRHWWTNGFDYAFS